jgi:hypothetical protein
MKWAEIDRILDDFSSNLQKAGDRIKTAKKNRDQIYYENHKPWYTKRIKIVQRQFLLLKRRFRRFDSISEILLDLENPLAILVPPRTDIDEKLKAFADAEELLDSLEAEIQRKREEEFDILPRESVDVDTNLCFVMMPFKPRTFFTPVFRTIRRATKRAGVRCVRSDEVFDTRAVILDIWENIRKSKICVVDITNKNPNVFYELGMAHTLPRRTILISNELAKGEKPVFDVNYVRCIFYKNSGPGLKLLERNIYKTIRKALT